MRTTKENTNCQYNKRILPIFEVVKKPVVNLEFYNRLFIGVGFKKSN